MYKVIRPIYYSAQEQIYVEFITLLTDFQIIFMVVMKRNYAHNPFQHVNGPFIPSFNQCELIYFMKLTH